MSSDEDRRRDNLTKARQNPDFEARRLAALHEWWQSPESKASLSAGSKKGWAKRRRNGTDKGHLPPEQLVAHAEKLRQLNQDPAFAFKRDKAARKTLQSPAVKVKRLLGVRAHHDKQRGFKVPARLWPQYQELRNKGRLSAREAGRALGLIEG